MAPDPLLEAAARVLERVRTCHERVACPKCRAPIGLKCRRVSKRTPIAARQSLERMEPLKHPHRERHEADGTPVR